MLNKDAYDLAILCQTLINGCYSFHAAMQVIRHPKIKYLMPQRLPGQFVPIGEFHTKTGGFHQYDYEAYLEMIKDDPVISTEIDRLWAAGSILRIGDELAKHKYFDKAPELELIRHLRNGVAHGNRFEIRDPARLKKYPAHGKFVEVKNGDFEITISLQNQPVLFDFMEMGDLINLFIGVMQKLHRIAAGNTF